MLLKSDEVSGSGKNHVLDICKNSYENGGLGAVIVSPPYNFLTSLSMNPYCRPWRKTSRNRSKPRKWSVFLFNVKIVSNAR